jgi:hypothetical protein
MGVYLTGFTLRLCTSAISTTGVFHLPDGVSAAGRKADAGGYDPAPVDITLEHILIF